MTAPTYNELRAAHAARLSAALGLTREQAFREVGHMASKAAVRLGLARHVKVAESRMPSNLMDLLERNVSKRIGGAPLAHVLGCEEFMGMTFACGPGALIPRPETETLVGCVVEHAKGPTPVIADLGAGSGCVALALARLLPDAKVVACEKDAKACVLARANMIRHSAANVELVEADWRELGGEYNIVASNPPYVTTALCERMERHDPLAALDGGADGLGALRSVINTSRSLLATGGQLFLEHGVGQHVETQKHAEEAGFEVVGHKRDLQGLRRVMHLAPTG